MKFIIILDDDEIAQIINKKVISWVYPHLETICFYSPLDCLKFLESIQDKNEYILFSDLNLPDLDGWSFISEVIHKSMLPVDQIMVVTSEELCEEGLSIKEKLGIKHCIPKPLTVESLKKHLPFIS